MGGGFEAAFSYALFLNIVGKCHCGPTVPAEGKLFLSDKSSLCKPFQPDYRYETQNVNYFRFLLFTWGI